VETAPGLDATVLPEALLTAGRERCLLTLLLSNNRPRLTAAHFSLACLRQGAPQLVCCLRSPLICFTLHPVLARTTEKSWSDVGSINEFQNLEAPVKKLVTIEQRDGWRKTIAEKPVYSYARINPGLSSRVKPNSSLPWRSPRGAPFQYKRYPGPNNNKRPEKARLDVDQV
jgi:hypothetical protein